jgi:hypothetical protein
MDVRELHIDLFAGESRGQRTYEPIHVTQVRDGVYRVLYSPGLVYGIAAGDEIRALPDGEFEVLQRGPNLAVRVFSDDPIRPLAAELISEVQRLGGHVDGGVHHGLAFTIPIATGFAAIETVFDCFVRSHTGSFWEFGNIFDSGGKLLNWWAVQGEA